MFSAGALLCLGQVVLAELADPFPQRIPVDVEVPPQGRYVVDGVGDHHFAPAAGVLVDAVQVATELAPPAGVVLGDGSGHLRDRVPGVDCAQDGQERRSRVPQQLMGVASLAGVDVDGVPASRRVALGVPGKAVSQTLDAVMDPGRPLEALQRDQLPLVGDVAIVAKAACGAGVPGEDEAFTGGPGDDVGSGCGSRRCTPPAS